MFGRSRVDTKTPDQIRAMRKAGLVVGQTLQLMAQTVRPGMTTKQLDELAEEHIRGAGGVPSFLGYHGFTGSLCTSVNEEVVHGIPGPRVLAEGDLISIDCGAIVDGWHGDAAISVIVGGREAGRPEDLALIDLTEDSMWAGIAALSVGESLYAVGAAVEDSIVAAGDRLGREYGIVEDYVGHGIGTEMHMDPQVPNYRVREKGPTVRSGLTVAIEPMVTLGSADSEVLADDWTVVTLDKSRAAHWENTVAVTDDGLWVLTALDGGKERLEALGAAYAPLD
ncbi:type I methionyl aminopeptidase [Knoellia koreensis]|uniref:Methionine aminopeptidase n=1 Tax=Knoellia koreensis TaxID=2730921 RepID=A0A849HEZ9_9MICO|nr:type I methionyl aminopeptidase [Knoellia sp. DB2414S]NNM45988.1 type I methionyl aminopeptidase [Knoellia sp. DB2414S]